MKIECSRGFGKVEGPDGEEINTEDTFEVDSETGEYILNNYPGMEVVEDDSETVEEEENPTPEPEETTFRCGVNGCSRNVESEDATCWQH